MFKFLFVIFFFFLLLLFLMGFSILRTFKKIFFGSGNQSKSGSSYQQTRQGGHTSSSRQEADYAQGSYDRPQRSRRKIFTKDEGEYVDYEEVK